MESLPPDFLSNMGSGVAANMIFVFGYLLSLCLRKRVRHSECNSGCFSCKTDIENTLHEQINLDEKNGKTGEPDSIV